MLNVSASVLSTSPVSIHFVLIKALQVGWGGYFPPIIKINVSKHRKFTEIEVL